MKHYKSLIDSEVYAFKADGSQDSFITDQMQLMTEQELADHKALPPKQLSPSQMLAATDLSMVRMIEDLTDTLITKGIITANDLPEAAQTKLIDRKALRAQMNA
jgi:hypothetical protein